LFDIDGTLLLSGGAGSRAIERLIRQRYGIAGAMKSVSPAGKTDPLIFVEVLERCLGRRPDRKEVEELLTAYVPLLCEELQRSSGFRLMPRVREVLDEVSALPGAVLGLATGNVRPAARAKLQRA